MPENRDGDVPDEPAADLEYDLAHEVTERGDAPPVPEPRPPVYVATHTDDQEGDYGYDMAHDVPGR